MSAGAAAKASIDNLAALWASLDSLLADLSEEEWKLPTGCPEWSVQDNVSHLIDYESGALGRPRPQHAIDDSAMSHLKNDMGRSNEVGVDFRRSLSGADVLAEFREVTAARLSQLQGLGEEEFAREIDLPVGRGTVADMLTLRVMDTWTHEQDIRRAVGRPGHESGPAAEQAVDYFARFLPIVVVKRAEVADGSTVVFELDGRAPLAVRVEDGRGSLGTGSGASDDASVVLKMTPPVFGALVCGRADVGLDDVEISGDRALGERVAGSLAFMP